MLKQRERETERERDREIVDKTSSKLEGKQILVL